MRDYNALETTFTVKPSASTREWLAKQLIAVSKLVAYTENELTTNQHATPLFGQPREILAKVVPEAEWISSYVNYGMAGIRMSRLRSDLKGKFRYRTPKPMMQQYPDDDPTYANQFYISGMPGGLLEVVAPQPLEAVPITTLVFAFDKLFKEWKVTVIQKAGNPAPRKPRRTRPSY
jgi:hypothetical protein